MDMTTLTLIASQTPVIASLLATGALLLGLLRRQEAFVKSSLYLFVFAALAALPIYLGGEASASLPLRAFFGIEVMGLLALGALMLSFQNAGQLGLEPTPSGQDAPSFRSLPLWAAGVLAGLSLLNNGVLVQTAYAGGQGAVSESIAAASPEEPFSVAKIDSEPASESPGAWTAIDNGTGLPADTSAVSRSDQKTEPALSSEMQGPKEPDGLKSRSQDKAQNRDERKRSKHAQKRSSHHQDDERDEHDEHDEHDEDDE